MKWTTQGFRLTLNEMGAIASIQFVLGRDRLNKQAKGIPLRRFDIAVVKYWRWRFSPIEDDCGCKGFIIGCVGILMGKH